MTYVYLDSAAKGIAWKDCWVCSLLVLSKLWIEGSQEHGGIFVSQQHEQNRDEQGGKKSPQSGVKVNTVHMWQVQLNEMGRV